MLSIIVMTAFGANARIESGSLGHVFPVSFSLFVLIASLPVLRVNALREQRLEFAEVGTNYGRVRGERLEVHVPKTILDTKRVSRVYDRFLGVPYAEPPLGRLRFAAPEPMKPWNRVIDTFAKKPCCPQPVYDFELHYINQSEDCLYLNIFSPYDKANPDARYPVMLYIHGGSFESGSGHLYDGKILCSMGVVVVTINYRLGALGFLTSGDDILPGNYGVRDQLAAMKWIKENIAFFRGDPNKVTLIGHSVGASSVGLLMTIEEAKGLYHTVIAQSGSASALYSCYNNNFSGQFKEYIRKVGKLLNCPAFRDSSAGNERLEILNIRECLRGKDVQVYMDKRLEFPFFDSFGVEFKPYADGDLIVREPRESFKRGKYNKVPFFTGTVEREFNFYFEQTSDLDSEPLKADLEQHLLRSFNNKILIQLIKFQYAKWSKKNSSDMNIKMGELISDFHVVAPSMQLADIVSSQQKEVYYYYFRHPLSYHSIELSYLFGTPFGADPADDTGKINYTTSTDEDRELSLYIMEQWAHIAKTGSPSAISNVQWPQYNRDSRFFLNMSLDSIRSSRNLRQNRVFFWNEILPLVFPDTRQVLGSGLTSFDKYPSAKDEIVSDVKEKRSDYYTIVTLSIGMVVLIVLAVALIGWLARLKIQIEELKKVTKHPSDSNAVIES